MAENLYAELARSLADGIASGRYPVGSRLPTEMELAASFGASRHTVRAALRELQELGLISRRKKAGTRVEASTPTSSYRHSIDSVDDLVQFGATHKRVVREVSEIVADRTLAKRLGCAPGARWLRISSLRLEDSADRPVAWTDVYVDPAYSQLGDIARDEPGTLISALIESRYGRRIAEIRQEIRGILIPASLAQPLQTTAGSAGLEVIRRYLDHAGENVEVSITVHPADRFTVSTRLTRTRG
jgi:DNA-binding GntR family transcriptional regulator